MIRNSVAQSMGLTGKSIKIYLTKVGGTEEELDTIMYKLTLCTKNKVPVQSIQAVGIPQISDEVTDVNVDIIASKFNVPVSDLKREAGPIDVLVGINYPNLHVGETKVKDGLVLRKGPLGWVVFGVKEESSAEEHKQVMHVRVANPVDITEFWSTESMGVTIQPCTCQATELSSDERKELNLIEQSCKLIENRWQMSYPWKRDAKQLPNNYSQVLKKLESTERRLSKQPEYAESYNKQIKEMEEMGFSRKLTQEELQTYNGPVHYISHHAVVRPEKKSTPIRIVFNSSATYQGHQLNDYWYKGPDLLNSLFGVILRFRENSIAVVADISKMYHMITIPLYDQHVHRFIWRYLETDREPDTYVKKVLTFGDRPSPAMATVALRKTAQLKEDEAPKAAEAIIKNTYMDDICDSVDSADEANKLTSAIDNILATGGFKVKGWTSNASKDEQNQEVILGAEEQSEKVLGVVWNTKEDKFSYKINSEVTSTKDMTGLTKRKILSKVAGIFDPIGAAAAILIKAKIAMQELWQLGLGWVAKQLKEYCADRGMKWQFTTPLAPHQNGCAESMVKSVKKALKKAIGDTVLTPFELYTCLLEASNLVNQRPIGRIPNDPNDGAYLCPNDILLGRCSNTVPQGPFRQTKNPRHRFEFCQRIVDSFWKAWSRDVLPALNLRKKWHTKNRNAQVGDYVVFIKEENDVRGKWNTGVVEEVFQGNDGLVRNVLIHTKDGDYRRPMTKVAVVYPIEGLE